MTADAREPLPDDLAAQLRKWSACDFVHAGYWTNNPRSVDIGGNLEEAAETLELLARDLAAARAERDAAMDEADRRTHEVELCYGVQMRLKADADRLAAALGPFAAIANDETVRRKDSNPENMMLARLADCRAAAAALASRVAT